MNKSLSKYLKKMYSLKNIIRYNNIPRVTNETVAEHSFFVAMIVRELRKQYCFDLPRALEMSLIHDQNEIYLGDVVATVKAQFDEVKYALEDAEDEIAIQYFNSDYKLFEELRNRVSVESKIVKLADMYSVIQYTSNELLLGSNPDMKKIQKSVQQKIAILEKDLLRCNIRHIAKQDGALVLK